MRYDEPNKILVNFNPVEIILDENVIYSKEEFESLNDDICDVIFNKEKYVITNSIYDNKFLIAALEDGGIWIKKLKNNKDYVTAVYPGGYLRCFDEIPS